MAHDVPDLFLHLGQTHVHHLNYGIFLLSAVGAWLLFAPQTPARRRTAALFYGMGMALTYDEFGMWLHLGGSYWQRASWDAVGVVTAILALAGFAWPLKHYANRHWAAATAVLLSTGLFFALLVRSLPHAERLLIPRIQAVEENAPL